MRITELFDNGQFVVTAEVGPPKGIDASAADLPGPQPDRTAI